MASPVINILWQFSVRPEHHGEFESVYGSDGDWAKLFAQSPAYHGTTLLRGEESTYITLDRWDSEEAFAQFKQVYAQAYAALDARCEAFTVSEKPLGVYNPLP